MTWEDAVNLAQLAGYELDYVGSALVTLSKQVSLRHWHVWHAWGTDKGCSVDSPAQVAVRLLERANRGDEPDEEVRR
jgi:hypothetical protein